MKKYSSLRQGFTLVELMIVIAIIGILAAVLYPSLSGYINGARDSSRISALKNISLSLASYQKDNGNFPWGKKCINELRTVLGKHATNISTDPSKNFWVSIGEFNCQDKGGFAYRSLSTEALTEEEGGAYALAARMEKPESANLNSGSFNYHNTVVGMLQAIDEMKAKSLNDRWFKTEGGTEIPYYVVVN